MGKWSFFGNQNYKITVGQADLTKGNLFNEVSHYILCPTSMRDIFPLEFSPRNPQVKIMNYDKLLLNKNYLSTASFCFPINYQL